jgi:hypothetical protein
MEAMHESTILFILIHLKSPTLQSSSFDSDAGLGMVIDSYKLLGNTNAYTVHIVLCERLNASTLTVIRDAVSSN